MTQAEYVLRRQMWVLILRGAMVRKRGARAQSGTQNREDPE
jgi:hypothetical protein